MASKKTTTDVKSDTSTEDKQARIKDIALRHALEIEAKKKLQSHVSDLAYQAFDLPTQADADPAHPSSADLSLFRKCLQLFRPEDLDELCEERNIDNRCGYALCNRPNKRLPGQGTKAWNGKTGKDFAFVDKTEKERWCSKACEERNQFIRRQLKKEPAWLRDAQNTAVQLPDDIEVAGQASIAKMDVNAGPNNQNFITKTAAGEDDELVADDSISIFEKETTAEPLPPQLAKKETIEGLTPRDNKDTKTRFRR